jgi:hypothetical protein
MLLIFAILIGTLAPAENIRSKILGYDDNSFIQGASSMSSQGLTVTQQGDKVQVQFCPAADGYGSPPVVAIDESQRGAVDVQTSLGLECYVGLNDSDEMVRIISASPSDRNITAAALQQWIRDGFKVSRVTSSELNKLLRTLLKAEKLVRETVVTVPQGVADSGEPTDMPSQEGLQAAQSADEQGSAG